MKQQVEVKFPPFIWYLFPVFLVLKLTHVINWSWWWVFAPLWIPVALAALLVAVIFASALFSTRTHFRSRR